MVRVAYEQDTNWDCLDVRQFWCRPLPLDEWKAHPNSPCSHEFVLRVSPSWALSHKMAPNHAPLLEEDFAMFFWPVHGWVVSLHIHIYICIFLHIHIHISGHHSQAKGQWVLSAVQRLSGEMLSDIFTDSSSRGYLDGILSHQWTNSMQCREVVAQEAPCVGFRGV